jgi:hypothetical protein
MTDAELSSDAGVQACPTVSISNGGMLQLDETTAEG